MNASVLLNAEQNSKTRAHQLKAMECVCAFVEMKINENRTVY